MAKKIVGFHAPADLPFKAGDKVRIKKGTVLKSMHPQKDNPYEAGRSYTIEVHHVLPGSDKSIFDPDEPEGFRHEPYRNPSVRWPGSGGYWVEADINDVEPVEQD